MLMRPSWGRASTGAKCDLIRSHHRTGITGSGLAASISMTTGEIVTRQMILGIYRRYPFISRTHPLGGMKLTIPTPIPLRVIVPAEARAYDAAAPGVTVLAVTDRECRWPVRQGLFCGHPAQGRYCAHHEQRARRDT